MQRRRRQPTAHMLPLALAVLILSAILPGFARAQESRHASNERPRALEISVPGGRFVGLPVHWSTRSAILLESSGQFQTIGASEFRSHRLLPEAFQPQSLPEARGQLASELGPSFETIVSGPYVIAAPRGEAARWQERFTKLLAGYIRYFEVRGWQTRKPDFPLCVVVFPDRESFLRYASTQVSKLPEKAVGSYFPKSNRCILYQIPGTRGTNWSQTESTIVHEAIHQLAYNTGIHERLFSNPLWVVEGLATMFEASATYDSGAFRSTLSDRMNREMLAELKPLFADSTNLEAQIESLIVSDQLFQQAPIRAYAIAWGMTFTLAERMPNQYGHYLQLQRSRGFGDYGPGERMADFRNAFGTSPTELTYQMQRLLEH